MCQAFCEGLTGLYRMLIGLYRMLIGLYCMLHSVQDISTKMGNPTEANLK